MKLYRTGVILVLICVLVQPLCVVSVKDSSEFQITSESHDQRWPAIYKDIVVWMDNRNGNWDIYGFNVETGEEFQVTEGLNDQKNPAIYKDIVVWEDVETDIADFIKITGYNLATNQEVFVTEAHLSCSNPAIYKDIVVWEEYGDIYGFNLETQQEFQITSDLGDQEWPAIYEDYVVWQGRKRFDYMIYGFNLSTGEEVQISSTWQFLIPGRDHYTPVICGDIVIWKEGEDGNICGYNLSTSERLRIAAAQMGECDGSPRLAERSRRPAIYGDFVAWVDCRNGNEDIYGFNLATGEEFQITTNEERQLAPAIYDNLVVWQDYQNGNWDIYGFNLRPPFATTGSESNTKLIFGDFCWMLLMLSPVLFVAFMIGRSIWYMKTLAVSEPVSAGEQRDFKRDYYPFTAFLVLGIMYGIMGFLSIDTGLLTGYFWLILSATWFLLSFWYMKIPYVCIRDGKLILIEAMGRKPKIINLDTLEKLSYVPRIDNPSKVDLIFSDKKSVRIDVSTVHRKEREDLIPLLRKFAR